MTASSAAEPEAQPERPDGSSGARAIGLGAMWNVGAYLIPQILTLILSIIVARMLGPTEQGVQSYIMFIAVTVGALLGLGLPNAVEQVISSSLGEGRPELVRYAGWMAIKISAIPAVLSGLIVLGIGRLQYSDWPVAWAFAALAAAMVTTHAVVAQGLNGLHEFRVPSAVGLACAFLAFLAIAIALPLGGGVNAVVIATAMGMIVSATVTTLLFTRRLPTGALPAVPTAERVALRRKVGRFAVMSGALVVLETVVAKRSEFVFLALFHHDRADQIAYFSVAFAAATAAAQVPRALSSVTLPVVSRLIGAGNIARVRTGYHSAQRLMLLVSAPLAGLLLACGGSLVLVAYGERYLTAAHLLLITTVGPMVAGPITSLASAALLGADRASRAVRAQLVAAVVTIIADLALIPPFAAYGAAVASTLGTIVGCATALHQARATLDVPAVGARTWLHVLGSAAASALPGLALLLAGVPHLVTLIGGGLLGLVTATLYFRLAKPLRIEDRDLAAPMLMRAPVRVRELFDSFASE
ncbi:MAG: polysaccharide biosynthesis C-terminal domain-containing protein [Micrococcales bacterium]|nr:polysaccharide biosynthesis C-terminal domain-containing protein [Micrococcales bacterium]